MPKTKDKQTVKKTARTSASPKELAFEIRDSRVAGKGAFATRPIKKGERLIEYTGERIPHPVADERYDDDSMGAHHTFLFTVSSRTVIDATHGGNEARFINHSCDPNCESEIEKGRVYIFALRDIKVGEELAYDYAYERSGDETQKEEKLYACRCGAKNCRGSIMEPIEDFKKRQRALARKRAATRAKRKSARA
ncbi:MAG TPA: SET domain-containing protein-lysine N-methyltransferase [Gemmatimonadaceae bacterium]|nr:SET domain-containing protein-lysine N-methyltransferase [Gemmatimonadaceae bacterium]